MKLRLLLTETCNRSCDGCCNKDWDLSALPVCEDFTPYDMIILTGGEPMLFPLQVKETIRQIRQQTPAPIVLYTARPTQELAAMLLTGALNGVTLTLHKQRDIKPFQNLREALGMGSPTLRLNVFAGISLHGVETSGWKVRAGMKWIKDCPLPDDEVFMRLAESC
ncbi:MAG: radical SAM protein [bacterium]|nr:radical SAM protein [bacterium]